MHRLSLLLLPPLVLCAIAGADPIVVETEMLRLVIGEDATVQSLTMAGSETELARPGLPAAYARTGDTLGATSASVDAARITYAFGDSGISATVSWEDADGMPVFTLEEIAGNPDQLDFIALPLAEGGELRCGGHAVLCTDGTGVALLGGSQECLIRGDATPRLLAGYVAGVSGLPLQAAVMAAPWSDIPEAIVAAEARFGIPVGMKAKLSEAARGTYLMISGVAHDNIDEVIDWAERGGMGSILIIHGTWGHFGRRYAVPEATFPGGIEQLRAAVDRIHEAGLLAGAHMFSSKQPKSTVLNEGDADPRFYEDLHLTLAEPLAAEAEHVVTTEPPTDWPVTTGTRDIRIGGELMVYTGLSLDEPFGFTGVRRGMYGTSARAHEAGAEVGHVKTDESRGIFIIDQTTDLLDEHTADIARTYNAAGFDWIYFDGAEDVHDPRWFTTSNAQMAVIEKLDREPALVQMAASSPFSWHLATRVGQRDYFWVSPSYKDEIDDAVERSWPRARRELMVADLGWFPLSPGSEHRLPTQVDDVEYLCARALATDSAYSILTGVDRMRRAPSLDAILHIMGRYEHHKFAGTFDEALKERIREPHRDWMLIEREGEEPRLVPAREMPYVGGTSHLVRAFTTMSAHNGVTSVSLAPVRGHAELEFSLDPRKLTFTDYAGRPYEVEVLPGARVVVPVTTRVFMHCSGISPGELRMALRRASDRALAPPMVFADAGAPARIEGGFATAEATGEGAVAAAGGAIGGVLLPETNFGTTTGPEHWAEYQFDLPEAGRWLLWIRAKYLDTNSNSFFLWNPEKPEEPTVLGNRIGTYHEWLWEGPIELELPAGRNVIRITGREGRALESPVLDVVALVRDAYYYMPTDGDARAALRGE